jgi:predicted nucleotide-binding protein
MNSKANEGQTFMERFEKYAHYIGYAFVLLAPEDIGGKSNKELKHRARHNLILELGYLTGKLGRSRICILVKSGIEIPSDLVGTIYIIYDKSIQERFSDIISELHSAGYKLPMQKDI